MHGKIIVIDGMDGVGKNTQANMLYNALLLEGYKVKLFSFPNYKSNSSYFVKKFLNGEYKDIQNYYLSSTFYAIDRAITWNREIKEFYDQGYIIILDRYYISNLLYQIIDINEYAEKMIYIQFLGILEVESFKLPIPDLTILLYTDPKLSNKLIDNRYNSDDSKRDIYENIEIQRRIYNSINFIINQKNKMIVSHTLGPIEKLRVDDGQNIMSKEEIFYSIKDITKLILE